MNDAIHGPIEPGHGHSPAAWSAVIIMLIGVSVGTLFFTTNVPVGVFIGVALIFIGLLTGWVMAKAGWGVNGPKYKPKAH